MAARDVQSPDRPLPPVYGTVPNDLTFPGTADGVTFYGAVGWYSGDAERLLVHGTSMEGVVFRAWPEHTESGMDEAEAR
jgi:hypothetical protein